MLQLLLGPDDFTKKEYIQKLAADSRAEVQVFRDAASAPRLSDFAQQSLFEGAKVYVVEGIFSQVDWEDRGLDAVLTGKQPVLVVEKKLDKRLNAVKQLLANKQVVQKEFFLPHGKELDKWLIARAKVLGGSLSAQAADALARRLGRDDAVETKFGGKVVDVKEMFTLWQAGSELKKLLAFAGTAEIRPEDVEALVHTEVEIDALEITNAIGDKDKKRAMALVHGFLETENSTDEKSGIIQLSALLAEQLRSVAVVQDFLAARMPEPSILEKTGWKSGRLFVMKKVATRYPANLILDTLHKLDALDTELKTSSTPPRAVLDLILAQLL